MLNRQLPRSLEGATGANGGGAGGGGPCGPRFCTRRSRGGFGLGTRRTIGPASEHRPAGTEPEIRLPGQEGARGRARTRENAAVERREASTLRYWVLDASLGVQAVPVWHGQGAGASRTERLPALYPLVFEGTKKEAHPARFEAAS